MLRGSLVWKLAIWFLLLSLLPIGVIVLFVRQDVSDELTNLAKIDTGSQASLLANGYRHPSTTRVCRSRSQTRLTRLKSRFSSGRTKRTWPTATRPE